MRRSEKELSERYTQDMILYIDGGCLNNGDTNLSHRKMVSVVADERGQIIDEREAEGGSNNIASLRRCFLRYLCLRL